VIVGSGSRVRKVLKVTVEGGATLVVGAASPGSALASKYLRTLLCGSIVTEERGAI